MYVISIVIVITITITISITAAIITSIGAAWEGAARRARSADLPICDLPIFRSADLPIFRSSDLYIFRSARASRRETPSAFPLRGIFSLSSGGREP